MNALGELFGTKELLRLVVHKVSSQILLFSLALVIILAVTISLLGLVAAIPILFIFVVGTVGYLFFEQKGKAEQGDEATMNRLLADKLRDISKPAGEFSVRVWTTPAAQAVATSRDIRVVPTNKDTRYRVGDKISVRFQSTQDCYLTLLNIGTSGNLTILFPNALHRDNRISANRVYEIPGNEYNFEYQLQGPPGIERLKAIATLEKVDLLEIQFTSDGSLFLTEAPAAAARDIAVMKRTVDGISSQQWAEDTWEFQVVR